MQKLERDALKARIAMLEEQVRCAQIGLAKAHLVVGGVPPLPHVTVTHCNCGAADRTAHRADCMARWPGGFVQDNRPDPLLGDMDVFGVRNLTAETKAQQCEWVFDNGQYIGSCDPNKFINISPAGMTYCPYCGRPVITLKTKGDAA
jgi:hypothetical protein